MYAVFETMGCRPFSRYLPRIRAAATAAAGLTACHRPNTHTHTHLRTHTDYKTFTGGVGDLSLYYNDVLSSRYRTRTDKIRRGEAFRRRNGARPDCSGNIIQPRRTDRNRPGKSASSARRYYRVRNGHCFDALRGRISRATMKYANGRATKNQRNRVPVIIAIAGPHSKSYYFQNCLSSL